MTEQLHNYLDLEFPNKLDKVEEEADKLNELTFNSEIPWEYDEVGVDTENFFRTYDFDKNEFNFPSDSKIDSNLEDKHKKPSDDLLGLTGSLINFGIFKSHDQNNERNEISLFKDDEFETAFSKLDLVDQSAVCSDKDSFQMPLPTSNEKINQLVNENASTFNVQLESPFIQLTKFSEILHDQFQEYQKSNCNLHVLNQIVSNHLNLLSKELQLLNLSMEILPQLRYFRILMSFVAIDNKLTEIQTKYATNLPQLNSEIAQIIQHFSLQSPQQQMELCITHPFYSNLMNMLVTQTANPPMQKTFISPGAPSSVIHQQKCHDNSLPEWASDDDKKLYDNYQNRCRNFDQNEAGWMSESEKDWLIKIQTRNLTTDNPYVHDYYYTKMKLKELTEARKLQILQMGHTTISDPLSLLPSPITGEQLIAGIDPNKDGLYPGLKPIHFEKSLGMLSPSNLNTPRQIIQLSPRNSTNVLSSHTNNDKSYKLVRNHRELLGLIEKMYSIVLRIDEVDKSLARMLVEQHKSRGVLLQHRNYLLKLLMDCMTNNSKFVDLLSVSKGARVVVATIAIVTSTQFIQVLRTLFFNCISVCESEFFNEIQQEMRSIVCSRVRNLQIEELSVLITTFYCNITPNAMNDNLRLQPLSGFCSNEFGLYIILTVLDSFLKSNPGDKAHVTQLLSITIKSTESQSLLLKCMKDFKYLFPSTTDRH